MSHTLNPRKTWSRGLLALNAIGAIVYVVRASSGWAIPQERAAGIYSVTGEPFVWFAAIFPIVVVFAVLNIAWAALIIVRRDWSIGRLWFCAATIWIIAIGIDFAHH
jgi:hypothetical protein